MNGTKTKLQYVLSQRKQARYHVVTPAIQPFISDNELENDHVFEVAYKIRKLVQSGLNSVMEHYQKCSFLDVLFRSTEVTFVRTSRNKDDGDEGYLLNIHYNVVLDSKFVSKQKFNKFVKLTQNKFRNYRDAGKVNSVNELTKYVSKPGELMNLPKNMVHAWSLAVCGSTLNPEFGGRSLRFFAFGRTKENAYLRKNRDENGLKPTIDFDKDNEPVIMFSKINQYTEKNGSGSKDPENVILSALPPVLEKTGKNNKNEVEFMYNPRWLFLGEIDDNKLHRRLKNLKNEQSDFSKTLREQIECGFANGRTFSDLSDWVQNLVKKSPDLNDLYVAHRTPNSEKSDSDLRSSGSEKYEKPPPKTKKRREKREKLFN